MLYVLCTSQRRPYEGEIQINISFNSTYLLTEFTSLSTCIYYVQFV